MDLPTSQDGWSRTTNYLGVLALAELLLAVDHRFSSEPPKPPHH